MAVPERRAQQHRRHRPGDQDGEEGERAAALEDGQRFGDLVRAHQQAGGEPDGEDEA